MRGVALALALASACLLGHATAQANTTATRCALPAEFAKKASFQPKLITLFCDEAATNHSDASCGRCFCTMSSAFYEIVQLPAFQADPRRNGTKLEQLSLVLDYFEDCLTEYADLFSHPAVVAEGLATCSAPGNLTWFTEHQANITAYCYDLLEPSSEESSGEVSGSEESSGVEISGEESSSVEVEVSAEEPPADAMAPPPVVPSPVNSTNGTAKASTGQQVQGVTADSSAASAAVLPALQAILAGMALLAILA